MPLFERNGFIIRFDEYIWELTCKMLRHWLDKGYRPTPVSINVSRMHFNDDKFCNKLLRLTDTYNLPRHLLELELTESAFFESEKTLVRAHAGSARPGLSLFHGRLRHRLLLTEHPAFPAF